VGVSDWLKRELSRHLEPAQAPHALWERLERRPESLAGKARSWTRWPIAAMLTLAAAAGAYWLPARPPESELPTERLAVQSRGRPDPSGDWALRCTLPARKVVYQVAAFSPQRIPISPMVIASAPGDGIGCRQCHSTIVN